MKAQGLKSEKKYKKWIAVLSIAIPLVVALLFGINLRKMGFDVQPLTFLPPVYASINGITAVILLIAFWAIKNKQIVLHKKLMTTAIGCSVAFRITSYNVCYTKLLRYAEYYFR